MIWSTLYNPAIDVVYPVEDISTTNTFIDIPSRVFPAGKGINFAKVVKTLGEDVSVMAIMPRGDQQRFGEYLTEQEIAHHFYSVPGTVRVNSTIVDEKSGITQHFNSAGQSYSPQIQQGAQQELLSLIDTNDYLVLSGSLPLGIEPSAYAELITACTSRNIPVALDTRGVPLLEGISSIPTCITPNDDEVNALYDNKSSEMKTLFARGKQVLEKGISNVFITLGANGVLALKKDECFHCKAPEIALGDTVGCGDAFLAGVIVGSVRKLSFQETCRLAVACGSSNAESMGPGEICAERVWALMEQVTVTPM